MSHSQSRPSPARPPSLARPPRRVGLLGILLLLSLSSAKADRKKCLLAGGAIDPSPRSRRAKREAAKLCATNGIKQREREKEWEGGEGSTTQSAFPPSSPVLMLLPFPFLTAGRSIGSRKRCTRNWPRPQTATYRASCPLPSSLPPRALHMRKAVSSQASERGKNNHTNKAVTANKRSESERAERSRRREPRSKEEGRKAAIRWISEEREVSRRQSGLGERQKAYFRHPRFQHERRQRRGVHYP